MLQKTVHNVGGKEITLKLADVPGYKSGDTSKKIFIGGVNDAHTEGKTTAFFIFAKPISHGSFGMFCPSRRIHSGSVLSIRENSQRDPLEGSRW